MALRELLAALEEEGAAEHERAQQDRRRQAAEIIADARDRGTKARDDALTAAETAAEQQAMELLIAARSDARRAILSARDDALDEVLGIVRDRLDGLPGTPAGAAACGACVDEALAALPHASTVHVHPADAAIPRTSSAVTLIADLETGGAIAADDHGRYIDNTYLTRLANTWPDLRVELSNSWDQDA